MDLTKNISLLKPFFSNSLAHPLDIIVFITSRCVGRCKHCFYWESINKEENPLTLEEYEKTAASMGRLLNVIFTGGEPFLREDCVEIIEAFYRHNRPVNLSLATSGFHPDKIVAGAEKILRNCPESGLTIGLPVEGPEELNDDIRGVKGFFKRTLQTYNALSALKKKYPNLTILIDITASGFNTQCLSETYRFIRDEMKPDVINLILTRGKPRDAQALDVAPEKAALVIAEMEDDIRKGRINGFGFFGDLLHAKDILLRRMSLDIYKDGQNRVPCKAGSAAGVILPEGLVYPCELWEEPLGDLRKDGYDMRRIWNSLKARNTRSKIVDTKCTCYHQCFLSPSIFYNFKMTPALVAEWLRIKAGI